MPTTTPITPDTITRTTLDNGLIVLVKSNPNNPSITLRGRLRAGGIFDDTKHPGLAHFTASALVRGTRKRTFQQLNEEMDRAGISFGVGAGMETVAFGGKALIEDLAQLLDIASDVMIHPTFPKKEVDKLRDEILTDLREAERDTQHVAYREFRALCYPDLHPFHHLSEGTVSSVKKIDDDDLNDFHRQYFRPDISYLVLVGDVEPDRAITSVQKAFGKWKSRGLPPSHIIADAPPIPMTLRKEMPIPGKTQLDIVLGNVGLRRTDPDYYALSLGDLIFGRLGLYGRLGASVRDKQGLAYYVYSGVEASLGAGPWAIHAGVNPKGLEQAIEGILGEMRRLVADPVTRDELDEAQDFVTGSLALRLETNDGVASTLSDIELYELGLDYLERYPGIIRAISPEQILSVVRKYANLDRYAVSIAGPLDGS